MMSAPRFANLGGDNDRFELDLGSGRPPVHKLDHRLTISERGDVIGAYCVAQFIEGGAHVEWMDLEQINAIKARSPSMRGKRQAGPWVTDEGQMQRKTVIRRAKNYWPLSVDMAQAFALDERAEEKGPRPDDGLTYEAEFSEHIAALDGTIDAEPSNSKTDGMVSKLQPGSKNPEGEWDHVGPPPMEPSE